MSMINRNRSRLGIKSKRLAKKDTHNKSPILLDSPKTLQSISPVIETGCSTPISTRKRSCFYEEESPSQDCDSFSPHYVYCSQEVHNLSEVVWQWNSPKRQVDEQKKKIEMKQKWLSRRKHIDADVKKKPKSPTPELATGFYKFQQELQHIKLYSRSSKNNDNNIIDSDNYDINNKNCDDLIIIDKNKNKIETDIELLAQPSMPMSSLASFNNISNIHSNIQNDIKCLSDTSSINNFLDDSDLDLYLLQCSQQAEEKLNVAKPINECIQSLQINKDSPPLINDSMDEFLNKLPLNEIFEDEINSLNKNNEKTNIDNPTFQHLSSGYETTCSTLSNNKIQFSRHNSMPESPGDKISTFSNSLRRKSLSRHISMPTQESQKICSNDSVKKRCSKEEIEKKRLLALEQRSKRYNSKQQDIITNKILINNYDNIKRNLNNKYKNDKK